MIGVIDNFAKALEVDLFRWRAQIVRRRNSVRKKNTVEVVIMMETPFPKSISFAKKYGRLLEIVKPSDTLGILINADPDSMASAMALKRIFWKKGGGCENFRTLRWLCD